MSVDSTREQANQNPPEGKKEIHQGTRGRDPASQLVLQGYILSNHEIPWEETLTGQKKPSS
jgi:hypothetical protein